MAGVEPRYWTAKLIQLGNLALLCPCVFIPVILNLNFKSESTCLEVQEKCLWSIDTYTSKPKMEEKQQLVKTVAQASKIVSDSAYINY